MQEAIWEDLPQVLWRTGYSSLGLMKLLLITGPPVLNLCAVSLVVFVCTVWLTFCAVLLVIFTLLWGVCVFNVTDMLPSMFHLHFQCFYWVLRNNRKQNPIYAASVIANTFSPLIHLSFTYTSALSVSLSLPAGVRFLCKAAWMSMEIRVLSVLLIHFSLWSFPSSQEQGPQSQTRVRALDASARTMAGRGGVRGLGSIDGQGYVLSGSLAAFALFCFVVTRKRKRYGSLFKRTIHTWEITRLGRDGALK